MEKLVPNISPDTMIGIRTPVLRQFAKTYAKDPASAQFMQALPHIYFEENNLHAFLIERIGDYDAAIAATEAFLPYIDNWATCDQLSPKVFQKHLPELLEHIQEWLQSAQTYTIRFGLGMLMTHYLDEAFDPMYLEWAAGVCSEEYYVNMMLAWYFATALAKQYAATIPYLQENRLGTWVHNKTIQKAVESRRISPEQKVFLKSLKRK